MRSVFRRSFIVAIVLGTSAVHAVAPAVVKSVALTAEMKVDGVIFDWSTLFSATKEVSVAAANNHDRLVIALATSDAKVKQRLLAAGVIVYLDPQGKKAKAYGVRIPPARDGSGVAGRSGGARAEPLLSPGAPPAQDPAGQHPAVPYVEVLGPGGKASHIIDLTRRTDFEVARGDNQGTLLIEVSIPLGTAGGIAFAAPVDPSRKVIGLGLVTPEVPSQGRGQPGEGGPGGRAGRSGDRGGMGGRGSGMGRGGPPPGGAQGKELKVWTSIELAPRSPY